MSQRRLARDSESFIMIYAMFVCSDGNTLNRIGVGYADMLVSQIRVYEEVTNLD